MDKLTKRNKNELVKDNPVIITLEEGRDFHCTRRDVTPSIEGPVEIPSNNEWTQLGCLSLLGYFMHWVDYLVAPDMLHVGLILALIAFFVQMFADGVLHADWERNYIMELAIVLMVIGACSYHTLAFYGLLAITVICLSIRVCKRNK